MADEIEYEIVNETEPTQKPKRKVRLVRDADGDPSLQIMCDEGHWHTVASLLDNGQMHLKRVVALTGLQRDDNNRVVTCW